MLRTLLSWALLLSLAGSLWSQEPPGKTEPEKKEPGKKEPAAPAPAAGKSGAELVKANPNDVDAWLVYGKEKLTGISELIESDPPAAIARLKEVEAFIKQHPATEIESQEMLERFSDSIAQMVLTAEIVPKSIAELAAEFDAKQSDPQALVRYMTKLQMELPSLVFGEPEKAGELVKSAKQLLVKAVAHSTDRRTEQNLYKALVSLKNQEAQIELGRKIASLEGENAAPLAVETWVQGKPLTSADLKGKVVLLDFWAIWCGACIQGFPQLRELEKEYGDKGLVIIGLTRYFQFKWDPLTKTVVQSEDEVSPAEERAAIAKFVASHDLKHRIAIEQEQEMSDYYFARALPHLVLIDQQGKIVKTFVGGGPTIDAQLSAELKKLLGGKEPAK